MRTQFHEYSAFVLAHVDSTSALFSYVFCKMPQNPKVSSYLPPENHFFCISFVAETSPPFLRIATAYTGQHKLGAEERLQKALLRSAGWTVIRGVSHVVRLQFRRLLQMGCNRGLALNVLIPTAASVSVNHASELRVWTGSQSSRAPHIMI